MSNKSLPRGIRNNNPGNLRITNIKWQGKVPVAQNTDEAFEQFQSMAFGIRAMLMDIINDIKKGKNTLQTLISEFAPSNENNTAAYVAFVSRVANVPANAVIRPDDRATLGRIIAAMIRKENGISLPNPSDLEAALDMVLPATAQKKTA